MAVPETSPGGSRAPSFPGRFLPLASGTERGHWPDGKPRGGVGGGSAAAPRARGRAELAVPAPPGRTEVQRSLPDSPACFPLPPPSPHPSPPLWRSPPSSGRHLPESRFCFGAAFSLAARRVCERRGRQAGGAARPPLAGPRRAERRTDGRTDGQPRHLLAGAHSPNSKLLSVCVHARVGVGGRKSRVRNWFLLGLPLDGVPGIQSRVSVSLRNC